MNLNHGYNRQDFAGFLSRDFLPGDFAPDLRPLRLPAGGLLSGVTVLGRVPSLKLSVLEATHLGSNDPRVGLSRETFRLMKQYNMPYALVAYHTDLSDQWRLSLVSSDLEYDEKNDRVVREFSNPRRHSFLLGPHAKLATAASRLVKKGRVTDSADLSSRFSLEVVNKEFYEKVAALYTALVGGSLKLPTASIQIKQEFCVRLIGRIVFCWFLKQKELIPASWLCAEGVKSGGSSGSAGGYYHGHIEPLFFQILNTKLGDRRKPFRGAEADAIPFLNGGLFSPHERDYYDYSETLGTSASTLNTVQVEDLWLSDFLSLLGEYNFTVDENTMVDIDLSIDPEMLGRIFENLLAEINPETGESARSRTGSFYTPRAIVDYMVTESLVHYLLSKSSGMGPEKAALEARYRELFSWEKELSGDAFTREEKLSLIHALHDMKCIDPACGSGAFPMGILQKTLAVLDKLDPDAELYLERQLSWIPDSYMRAETERSLRTKGFKYLNKLSIVQNCIYGVDLQPIAVEMSRLRAFLSLVVDAKVEAGKENRGIDPLPNLDFKFVSANTLLRLPGAGENRSLYDGHLVDELKAIRERYLTASGEDKRRLKERFLDKQNIMYTALLGWTGKKTAQGIGAAIAAWNPFADNASDWFEADWMFGIPEGGFDIVLGNPPYIQLQSMKEASALYKEQGYKTYRKTGDIYCLFYERGAELLKKGGSLCYITSKTWMRADYGENLRTYLLKEGRMEALLDFGDSALFESATTYTNIALWTRGESGPCSLACDLSKVWEAAASIDGLAASSPIDTPLFSTDAFIITTASRARMKKRMEEAGKPLGKWDISINYGIKTGLNEAFIVDQSQYDELVLADPKSAEILKPMLRGRDIKRYKSNWAGLYLIAAHNGYTDSKGIRIPPVNVQKDYPKVYIFMKGIGDNIESGSLKVKGKGLYNRDDQGKDWWNLRDCTYFEDFNYRKLFIPAMISEKSFMYDCSGYYGNDKTTFISCDCSKYLTALFNSSLAWFHLTLKASPKSGGFYEIKPMYISQLPVPDISPAREAPFNALVDAIQLSRKEGLEGEGDFLEALTDLLVFALYFPEEAMERKLSLFPLVAGLLAVSPGNAQEVTALVAGLEKIPAVKDAVEAGLPDFDTLFPEGEEALEVRELCVAE